MRWRQPKFLWRDHCFARAHHDGEDNGDAGDYGDLHARNVTYCSTTNPDYQRLTTDKLHLMQSDAKLTT